MRSLLLVPLLAAAACGGKTDPPPTPTPPRVELTLPESVVIGSKVDFTVSVTGCEQVSDLEILDHGGLLRKIPYSATPTASEVLASDFNFSAGLAAELVLTAKATCNDGRKGESQAAPARFLPAAEVISLPNDEYVVPELFYAEGQGPGVSFVGCSGVTGGTPTLIRVDRAGKVLRTMTGAPFPCSLRAIITDKNPTSGKRWLLEPDVGAYAFDSTLKVTAFRMGKLFAIGVGPEGDALLWDREANFEALHRVRHNDSGEGWATGFQPQGILTGNPIVKGTTALLPIWISLIGSNMGTVALEVVDYATAARLGRYELKTISYGFLDKPQIPPTAFSPGGDWVYIPEQGSQTTSIISSCATNAQPCATSAQQWVSPALVGTVQLVSSFAGGKRLVAASPQFTWFLDAMTGRPLNPNATALSPVGALVVNSVLEGKGNAASAANPEASCGATPCQDFYVFHAAPQTPSVPTQLPLEVVAMDNPARDPVFRLELASGSVTGAIDDGGALWLRVGPKLVRPFPLSEYRKLRGN